MSFGGVGVVGNGAASTVVNCNVFAVSDSSAFDSTLFASDAGVSAET